VPGKDKWAKLYEWVHSCLFPFLFSHLHIGAIFLVLHYCPDSSLTAASYTLQFATLGLNSSGQVLNIESSQVCFNFCYVAGVDHLQEYLAKFANIPNMKVEKYEASFHCVGSGEEF
jgi:hypothetical protein